jgi:uncharacterized repeat protein (TIGR03803 family)
VGIEFLLRSTRLASRRFCDVDFARFSSSTQEKEFPEDPMIPRSALVVVIISVLTLTVAAQTPTTTFTTITDFGEGDGQYPSPLAQGLDGNFYGAAYYGPRTTTGNYGFGFYLTSSGAWTLLDYLCDESCVQGSKASAGMTLAGDGNFYGTTAYGGNGKYRNLNQAGTIYRANAATGLTTLYSFCAKLGCQDGDDPYEPVILGSDGNLYGTTVVGGLHKGGTAYVITLAGKFNTLHQFCAQTNCADGGNPTTLIQATDGNFYGVAAGGTGEYCFGAGDCGMIFKMTPKGVTTALYNFCSLANCADGLEPRALMQGADGNLYGSTDRGGIYSTGSENEGSGTIFKLSLQGQLTTLYNFCSVYSCSDGGVITPSLLQANDGNIYGTVDEGEGSKCYFAYGCGTIFELTSAGVYSTLYTFCEQLGEYCLDGSLPEGLIQATDGNFYGVTGRGGPSGYGTAFQLSTGLAPFIQSVTSSGAAGSSVIILGNNLTGTTSVTFNGTAAAFTVVSSTEITATIPKGATTGVIEVITPTATLTSNKTFTVTN